MNLLAYTKKLYKQIAYYDTLTKNKFFDERITNPFFKPVNITIIWVDENHKD